MAISMSTPELRRTEPPPNKVSASVAAPPYQPPSARSWPRVKGAHRRACLALDACPAPCYTSRGARCCCDDSSVRSARGTHTDSAANGAKLHQRRIWCTSLGTKKAALRGRLSREKHQGCKLLLCACYPHYIAEQAFLSRQGAQELRGAVRSARPVRQQPEPPPYCLTQHSSPTGLGARPVGAGAERRGAERGRRGRGERGGSCTKLGFGAILRQNCAKLDTIWCQLSERYGARRRSSEEAATRLPEQLPDRAC